jgi:hypothetical protein
MFWLIALAVVTGLTIAGAKGPKWRLTTLAIILGFTGLGVGVGYFATESTERIALAVSFGATGAAGCAAWNKWWRNDERGRGRF